MRFAHAVHKQQSQACTLNNNQQKAIVLSLIVEQRSWPVLVTAVRGLERRPMHYPPRIPRENLQEIHSDIPCRLPKYHPFGDSPFSIKHPQDNFSLQNANWHTPKRKLTPSNLQVLVLKYTEVSPRQFVFWRASICIWRLNLSWECFIQGALKGTNLRGQAEPKRRFSLIFFCRFSHFPRKQSIWETRIFEENR